MTGPTPSSHDSLFGSPERLAALIVRYHDADLSDAELDELRDALKQNAKARDLFVRWGLQMQVMAEALSPEYREEQADAASTDVSGLGIVPASEQDYSEVLAELCRMEANAPTIDLPEQPDESPKKAVDPNALSARELVSIGGFALRLALTSKPAKQLYAYAGVAAVLLLAFVLFNPWAGSVDPDAQPFADDTPSEPGSNGPVIATHVATLTAQHNAQWSERASARGSSLRTGSELNPGDRLTLTQGFATITTNDGAVAILQAPCEIELTQNNNALHLHAGKLVGLCHSDSSKGFTVKTRHGDIVDLGTEFGVDLRHNALTTTVFTGEVTLTPPGGQTQSLTANQTAQLKVNGSNRKLVVHDKLANGFGKLHAMLPNTTQLPGTGQAIAVGQADPNWLITAIDGKALPQPVAATVDDPAGYSASREDLRFMPNGSASKWITPLTPTRQFEVNASVQYQTTFDASGFDLQTLALDLKFLADQQVVEIALNGRPVAVPTHGAGPAFVEMTELTLREGLIDGKNTLSFKVQRYRITEHAHFWTGMRAELELTGRRLGAGPNE